MLQNYLKIAIRNLLKFRSYAAINIAGLAIGVAACLLILQFVTDELSYDKHHGEDIYRVGTHFFINDEDYESGSTPSPLAQALQKDFPEIKNTARIYKVPDVDKWLLTYEDQSFYEKIGVFADSNIFEILQYDFVAGDITTALNQPFSVVIAETVSKKLFGEENAIGKTIEINSSWGENDYKITGVFDSKKYRSHLEPTLFVSGMSGNIGQRYYRLQEWGGNNLFYTYVDLKEGANPEALTEKFPAWLEGYAGERFREIGIHKEHFLVPISDIYLHSDVGNWFGHRGNITFIYILISVAAFILLIACINFMNLATAKATLRAREVGVRKVIGASRSMLMKQFMSEAFVYSTIAVLVAYVLSELALPVFNNLVDKDLIIPMNLEILGWLLGFILLTTLVAGSYPALYLSAFSPVRIFRNNFGNKLSSKQIRRGLVVLQFIISIALIQGILVINEQMDFIRNKNLGFNPEAKIILPVSTFEVYEKYEPLRNELLKNKQIIDVAATSTYPGEQNLESYFFFKDGMQPEEGLLSFLSSVTPEFMEMMDFELIKGRVFDKNRLADTTRTAIISEKTVRGLGYDMDNILGQKINLEWNERRESWEIIGIIKDYHANSLHQELDGQVFVWDPNWISSFFVASVETEELPSLLKAMEKTWLNINPEVPFQYNFMEQRLAQNYEAEQKMTGLIFWVTLLAIFISCLGLLGLAAFAAERREKEISVRKVLGASAANIVTLLSKDFLRLVVIALIFATPIAWYAMTIWLQDFHYHIKMPYWVFGLAGGMAIFVALATIFIQSLKAATINPVEKLKRE